MNQDVPETRSLRRCGNCRHAVRSSALDGSIVACIVRLEYHCADRIPDCGTFHPAGPSEDDSAED